MPIYDVLIIGTGAAGLGLTLSLANGAHIAIVSKDGLTAGSSSHAQGGIAAVMNANEDSVGLHIQDTLNAGGGLCNTEVVKTTITQAKLAIEWLTQQGVQFSTEGDHYHLTQEGGHSRRRVLHVADKTGAAIITKLAEQVKNHPNIDCFTNHTVIDLHIKHNRCIGALVYSNQHQQMLVLNATHTVLATGGFSFVYLHTSNPSCTSGDGIAMAWRAGCRVANLEFNQFHPTCLYHPGANYHLITEVVRGEGGYLLLPNNGKRFMPHYDKRAEMAPRDIVAQAIHMELKNHQLDYVYLDISHRTAAFIKKTFPTIYSMCLKFNLDMTKEPLPVVPAAHYTCGGVITDLNGQTDVPGLYAIGEVACTGLHGANRMASNSLLECLVFAANCARVIKKHYRERKNPVKSMHCIKSWIPVVTEMVENISAETLIQHVRKIMWDNVGIIRSNASLNKAKKELQPLLQEIETIFLNQPLNKSLIELRNIITIATLVIESALYRKESRGLHYNVDYPQTTSSQAVNTVLTPTKSVLTASEIIWE
ncbi:L-aspartate oxidase [Coxiella endosymbiont of Amblyomma nuttalli]|uniref:L-aspartate oxidase n=1 Tax=Coxiella endosymbiont of Amblyomma nuttalli TaxID=2749996 RepID=UPI001BAB55F8|nr:L-aspartate oxidase [Coxiella endosymbiont of Amblyomma nuttalli]QTS83743.1 L-aspartate oxidase [Coxiella endosymbiont of Amblyomma nuttalli]